MTALTERVAIGPLRLPNRVVLAPLAGIGNWFVRLQARRYGAGLVVSEMVSSFAVHHRNARTLRELLRIDPRERAGGPVSIQLFGADPAVMRSAARPVAAAGADLIDINMGCPVPKVCRTGAGAALLADPDRAVALARAAARRQRPAGDGQAALRLALGRARRHRARPPARRGGRGRGDRACIPARRAPRTAGRPDYELVAELVRTLAAPVILSGGLHSAAAVHDALARTGAAAVMLARGSLGNPWLFEEVLGRREGPPAAAEVLDELDWVIDCACEHLGDCRAPAATCAASTRGTSSASACARAGGARCSTPSSSAPSRSPPSASCLDDALAAQPA